MDLALILERTCFKGYAHFAQCVAFLLLAAVHPLVFPRSNLAPFRHHFLASVTTNHSVFLRHPRSSFLVPFVLTPLLFVHPKVQCKESGDEVGNGVSWPSALAAPTRSLFSNLHSR